MITFYEWLKLKETSRGGKGTDWVSADDYDPETPYKVSPDYKKVLEKGGQHYRNPHRLAGYKAREAGKARTENPHLKSQARHDWHHGWDDHHFISSVEAGKNPNDFPGHKEHPYD
jgi:ribosome modulation factor